MQTTRWRPVFWSAGAILCIWLVAMAGYTVAKNSRPTAAKIAAYLESVDFGKLSAAERAAAIRALADKINALSPEERRQARLERLGWDWFEQMTEAERGAFLEATVPTGFKQVLASFEQLPEEKRRKAIDDSLKQLRESQTRLQSRGGTPPGTNQPPVLSAELQAKVRTLGLQTFYSQSSPEIRAELAPVLEELQRQMETGRAFHGR